MPRVAVLQSNYIPWLGYFDLMDDVDTFIIYDDVQYTKSDWRNRNKLKTRAGTSWITVPVRRDGLQTTIEDARIDWTRDWVASHRGLILENYRIAPFLDDVAPAFFGELERRPDRLSTLNLSLIEMVRQKLDIQARIVRSTELASGSGKTERLVTLVQSVGGTTYLSGPAAEAYLDVAAFGRAGIAVEYKTYDYIPYPQLWGSFQAGVSVLDLLMNAGADARSFLKSRSPNRMAAAPS